MAARAKPAGRSAVKKRLKRPAKDVKKLSSGCLTKLLKVYKGLDDFHLPLFKQVQKIAKARRILYPGSHWHLQASLVFPDVTYVDYNQKVAPFFEDSAVLAWVTANKSYPTEPKLKICLTDFEHLKLPSQAFDLLISMSAGIVSKPCTRYLRVGGYFLVSDAHFDARTVALDKRFSLVGVYNMESKKLETKDLESCFMTTAGKITLQQVEVSKMSHAHAVIACAVSGFLLALLLFSFFGLVLWFAPESGGSAAANRIPALLLCSLISISCLCLRWRYMKRGDELCATFFSGAAVTAVPLAIISPLWLVKCLIDLLRPTGKRKQK
eukprot:symbB.v1.2.030257.t1/scaffold3390.1/size57886/6